MKITFKITEAVRERVISDDCEKLKVTAKLSNGETLNFHFELDKTKKEIEATLEKLCKNFENEKAQAEADAPRLAAEKKADATAKSLL